MERLTFAIGDIHGMYDALTLILKGINSYIEEHKPDDYRVVFLGDYIDRGPDSFKVVDNIRLLQLSDPERYITLRGNHEQMFLDAMIGGWRERVDFRSNGGQETLKTYGVDLENDIPSTHKKFFLETRHCYQDELRYFVHAGINPSYSLATQTNEDRLWIRELFLRAQGPFEKYIVHGHTPRPGDRYVEGASKWRLNLDFGAVFGGYLVCAVFNDTEVEPINYIKVGPLSRPGPL